MPVADTVHLTRIMVLSKLLASAVLLLGATAAFAQSATPQQVRQAQQVLQSGQPLPPGALEAAKEMVPELRGMSEQEIRQRANEQQASPEAAGSADANKESSGSAEAWRSQRNSLSVSVPGTPDLGRRFPEGLRRFGEDFFRNTDMEGLGQNSPALPDYILSPGDELLVYTWGRESRNQGVILDKEGMFQFPPLSPMRLAGMRFSAAQKMITTEIEKIHGVTASVSLGRLRSIRVMVLGEVRNPGSYVIPAGATVTSGLFRSGGVSRIGSMRAIEIRRSGKTVATLDLYDMLLKGRSSDDIQLLPGDAIYVPLAKTQVAVHGMVRRPAIYEIKPGPGLRALEAVDLAGGLNSVAFKGHIRVDRVQGNKRNVVLDVDMEKAAAKSNVLLADGDILFVDRILERLDDAVFLEGNVNRPGRFQYKPGMTVRDLIPSLRDLKPETFFEYAHIRRPAKDDERPTLLSFSLADVFSKSARVPLEPRDVVVIYSRYDVVERPTVAISGTVRGPGTFPYSEAMTVSDLVILGGGLKDAYMQEAHLLRVLPSGSGDSLYTELIRVNLGQALESPVGSHNLRLQPFDHLKVFPRENFLLRRSVNIYGAVRKEGEYELSGGMGLPELIKLAGGLTRNSYRLSAEVARRTIEGDSILTRRVAIANLKAILDSTEAFQLKDGDGIYVREVVNSRESANIYLFGEVRFPGRYEFTPGEKLSSIIRRAGGFTDEAYLRGAIFLRESVKKQQLRHAEEVGRRMEGQLQARLQQATDDKERAGIQFALARRNQLIDEIANAPYLGRVVIRVDEDLDFEGTDWDLELESGDRLYIGPKLSTVSVLGEVSSPTTLVYTRKTDQVGEVLGKAGGVNAYGDYKETFYIGPDGVITTPRTTPWYSSFRSKKVEPGGTVIVPLKPPAKDYLEIWAQSTQILYQLAITVGVAAALF